MKKNWVLVVAVAVAIGFVSCKAKESSYKAAYEKAQNDGIMRGAKEGKYPF